MRANMTTVAIHQPNFFPWLGYFEKIRRSDIFVFLDHVQFSKGGYTNRVQISLNGRPLWITCPIIRDSFAPIQNIRINDTTCWQDKIWGQLRHSYGKTPFWDQRCDRIKEMLFLGKHLLCEYNIQNVMDTANTIMGFRTTFIRSSELGALETHKTDMLIEILQRVGGDTYLAGGGAKKYQEDEKFFERSIQVEYLNYKHPVYYQHENTNTGFVSGMSVLDAIFNCNFQYAE